MYNTAPATVLLVESAQDDREMYAEYLRRAGFRAVEVDSTEEALTSARLADVVVTGCRVPGAIDGVEPVRRLRGDDRTRSMPVTVLTASPFEHNERAARAVGCDAFLPKPCL